MAELVAGLNDPSDARVTAIRPCGTGKSFVAFLTVEESVRSVQNPRVLILAPRVQLLQQLHDEWRANTTRPFAAIAVCSTQRLGRTDTDDLPHTALSMPTTTSVQELERFVTEHRGMCVVFATYQSSRTIAAAHQSGIPAWDMVVFDEAHHTAGPGLFSTCLSQTAVPAQRRLMLTATPNPRMSNNRQFGTWAHVLPYDEARRLGLLSPYELVVAIITDDDIHAGVGDQQQEFVVDGRQIPTATAARIAALASAAREYDLRRVLVYHNSRAASREFTRGLKPVFNALPTNRKPAVPLRAAHVDGDSSVDAQRILLGWLDDGSYEYLTIGSNVRLFGEGTNLPALDAIMLAEPRRSIPDVIQAVGRALRINPVRDAPAVIVLPVYLAPGENPEAAVEDSPFQHVWQALEALSAHDTVLAGQLASARRAYAETGELPDELPAPIRVITSGDFTERFLRAFRVAAITNSGTSTWDDFIGNLRAYRTEYGHTHVPYDCTYRGFALGSTLSQARFKARRNMLSAEQREDLNGLGVDIEHQKRTLPRDLVATLIDEAGHIGITADQLHSELNERGIVTTVKSARALLEELAKVNIATQRWRGKTKVYFSAGLASTELGIPSTGDIEKILLDANESGISRGDVETKLAQLGFDIEHVDLRYRLDSLVAANTAIRVATVPPFYVHATYEPRVPLTLAEAVNFVLSRDSAQPGMRPKEILAAVQELPLRDDATVNGVEVRKRLNRAQNKGTAERVEINGERLWRVTGS